MPAEPTRSDPAGDAAAAALPHAAPGIAAGQALAGPARATAGQATQPLRIGAVELDNRLILAPMAGVTDRPFRSLCRRLGAGLAVSEMVSSNPALAASRKSRERLDHRGEPAPIAVQIAGSDPLWMADAARANVDRGAQIIDINLGCPAKKVCKAAAGSALLRDEPLVGRILAAVVAAVPVPVTLKTRTGWSPETRNLSRIAHIARESGIVMLTVHGRTRACGYGGRAEFDSLRALRAGAAPGNDLLLAANGDIDSPERAHAVLEFTGADALMIGRAAQGRPWLFREIGHYLATGEHLPPPSADWVLTTLLGHLEALYGFYGATRGVRIARKHIGWYLRAQAPVTEQRKDERLARINRAETPQQQTALVRGLFDGPATLEDAA
jgi:tRNA-dihydrouridine synthase B